jgi:hypothetical protein
VPDSRALARLAALTAFIVSVALALWLLDAEVLVVVLVMAVAFGIAWTVEWLAGQPERPPRSAAAPEPGGPEPLVPAAPSPESAPVPSPLSVPSAESERTLAPAPEPPAGEGPLREVEEEPAAAPPPPPERPSLRRLPRLRPLPAPPSRPRSRTPPGVVDLSTRMTSQPRHWNLWNLERLARDELHGDPVRLEALSYLFVHLRLFASPDGSLPTEFDGLVRESFGDLLEHRR